MPEKATQTPPATKDLEPLQLPLKEVLRRRMDQQIIRKQAQRERQLRVAWRRALKTNCTNTGRIPPQNSPIDWGQKPQTHVTGGIPAGMESSTDSDEATFFDNATFY